MTGVGQSEYKVAPQGLWAECVAPDGSTALSGAAGADGAEHWRLPLERGSQSLPVCPVTSDGDLISPVRPYLLQL